jgi:hypothetical protein
MTVDTLDDDIARVADIMTRRHGERAEFFADVRCRELRAEGDVRAAALWADVARMLRDHRTPQH